MQKKSNLISSRLVSNISHLSPEEKIINYENSLNPI